MRKLSPLERAMNSTPIFLALMAVVLVATAMAMKWADSQWQLGSITLF